MPQSYAVLGTHALALLAISEQALTVGVSWEWKEGNAEDTEARVVGPCVSPEWSRDREIPSYAASPK